MLSFKKKYFCRVMSSKKQNINVLEVLFQKVWAVALLFSLFLSSGFVNVNFTQQPRIVQTEWVASVKLKGKKTLSHRFFKGFWTPKAPNPLKQNYKNLMVRHSAEINCLLLHRLYFVFSFKNTARLRLKCQQRTTLNEDVIA